MIGEIAETFNFGMATIDVVDFLKPEEVYIDGNEMLRRAKELKATPGSHYIKLALDRSDEIPESCDKYDLVLAGARLKVAIKNRKCEFIAYLRKVRGLWRLGYGNIDCDWDLRARLVRSSLLF
jgi:hypothetical protein